MTEGPTYLVVPVEHGDGLVCRIGTGCEAVTKAASYAAAVLGAPLGQVMAVWKFHTATTVEEAEEMAVLVSPSRLLICSSSEFGTLELSHEYTTEVDVIDVRPGRCEDGQ